MNPSGCSKMDLSGLQTNESITQLRQQQLIAKKTASRWFTKKKSVLPARKSPRPMP